MTETEATKDFRATSPRYDENYPSRAAALYLGKGLLAIAAEIAALREHLEKDSPKSTPEGR